MTESGVSLNLETKQGQCVCREQSVRKHSVISGHMAKELSATDLGGSLFVFRSKAVQKSACFILLWETMEKKLLNQGEVNAFIANNEPVSRLTFGSSPRDIFPSSAVTPIVGDWPILSTHINKLPPRDYQGEYLDNLLVTTYPVWLSRWCSGYHAWLVRGETQVRILLGTRIFLSFLRRMSVCRRPPSSYLHLSTFVSKAFLAQLVSIPLDIRRNIHNFIINSL